MTEQPKPIEVTPTAYITEMAEKSGMTEKQYIEKHFLADGFAIYIQESEKSDSSGTVKLKYVNSWSAESKPADIKEFRRLRENSPTISRAVDFVKDFLLGSGPSVKIDDPSNKSQVEYKEEIEQLLENIRQDRYTQGLSLILEVMVEEALVTGSSAAEIVYETNVNFMDYATESIVIDEEGHRTYQYETKEPEWKTSELGGITRLKLIDSAIQRLKLYRKENWEASFWSVDEETPDTPETLSQIAMSGAKKNNKKKKEKKELNEVVKLHPWQVFWLSINRRSWSEKSKSIIEPVAGLAQILEKIEQAIGEGLYRAGNKKYFIVTGSEKRQWGDTLILNVMKKINEIGADPNKVAIPVPSGFDIKEMGGQVFEGTEIVDHFVTMIADGMNLPKEVLTGVKGGQTERPWQASMVNQRRRQIILQNAIETQLFTPHIWCKFGKEKTKQSGRSTKPTPIPKVKWLHEDRMSVQEHLDMIYKILNVANPISQILKLEAEKDYANIMGYEINFPTPEQVKKEEDEIKKIRLEMQKLSLEKMKQPPQQPQQFGPDGKPMPPKDGQPLSKRQGDPEAPNEEKLAKRAEGGVSKSIKQSGEETDKGKSKSMGSSRVINESEQQLIETPSINLKIELAEPTKHKDEELNKLRKDTLLADKELKEAEKQKILNEIEVSQGKKKIVQKIDSKSDELLAKIAKVNEIKKNKKS